MHRIYSFIATGLLAAQALPVQAHHSQSMFDQTRCLTIAGTVRTFQFVYPHSWLWIYAPNGQGGQDVWGFEAAPPVMLMEKDKRWSRDVFKAGDKVVVQYTPLKDGRNGGALGSVTLPDGYRLPLPARCGDSLPDPTPPK